MQIVLPDASLSVSNPTLNQYNVSSVLNQTVANPKSSSSSTLNVTDQGLKSTLARSLTLQDQQVRSRPCLRANNWQLLYLRRTSMYFSGRIPYIWVMG